MLHPNDVPEFHDNARAALTLIYRCLLVGKPEDLQTVVEMGIARDAYRLTEVVAKMPNPKFVHTHIAIVSSYLLQFIAEMGDDKTLVQLQELEKASGNIMHAAIWQVSVVRADFIVL